MAVVIENPILNSPYVEPAQHFITSADGSVTGDIEPRRRPSEVFVPVARPKKTSGQRRRSHDPRRPLPHAL